MNESRQMVHNFLDLPHYEQIRRATNAGVFVKGENLRGDEEPAIWVKRAKEKGTIELLFEGCRPVAPSEQEPISPCDKGITQALLYASLSRARPEPPDAPISNEGGTKCADCGHERDDSGFHLEAPGTNWGAALHHFREAKPEAPAPRDKQDGPICPNCGVNLSAVRRNGRHLCVDPELIDFEGHPIEVEVRVEAPAPPRLKPFPLECDRCQFQTQDFGELEQHKKTHEAPAPQPESDEPSPIECCRRQFENVIYVLDRHPDMLDSIRAYAETGKGLCERVLERTPQPSRPLEEVAKEWLPKYIGEIEDVDGRDVLDALAPDLELMLIAFGRILKGEA